MYVLRPGAVSSPRNLGEILRARHEAERKAAAEDRARRLEAGAPLDDDEPWQERAAGPLVDLSGAVGQDDRAAARAALEKLRPILAEPLEDPGEWVEPPAAGLLVRFRALSHAEHVDLLRAVAEAGKAHGYASTEAALAIERYVSRAVAEVSGFEDDDGPLEPLLAHDDQLGADAMAILEASGALLPLYVAARDFQLLTGAEKKHYGRPAQTTSSASETAPPALNGDGGSTGATATPAPATGPAPSTRTTLALGVTSSDTRGSSLPMNCTSAQGGAL